MPLTDFDDAPRVPRRERVLPVDLMARTLCGSNVDLGDEAACADALTRRHFDAHDISAGLEPAIDRAREIKAGQDTPLTVVRDLACVAAFLAAVFVLALPGVA